MKLFLITVITAVLAIDLLTGCAGYKWPSSSPTGPQVAAVVLKGAARRAKSSLKPAELAELRRVVPAVASDVRAIASTGQVSVNDIVAIVRATHQIKVSASTREWIDLAADALSLWPASVPKADVTAFADALDAAARILSAP